MQDNTPTISVLMTAYNAQTYVEQTIDSVLAQTLRDFEFVIVDDGSTDATPRILANYAKRDGRIRIVSQKNSGIPRAANAGLRVCRGEFVARIDSDDVCKPHRLETQLAYIRTHNLIVCGSWHDMIDEEGRFLTVLKTPTDDADIQEAALHGHGSICHSTSLYRRKDLVDLGGYSEDLQQAEDLDVWLRLGERGRLGNIPQSLVQYRLHGGSISEQKCEAQRGYARTATERAWKRRGITDGHFEATYMWRPGADRASQHSFAMKYGWWAFNSGEYATALHYGQKAITLLPANTQGYKLVFAAFRKRILGGKPRDPRNPDNAHDAPLLNGGHAGA